VAGAGTGLAYAISNLPPLFAGPSEVRALLPALLAAAAALWPPREAEADEPVAPEAPLRFVGLVAAFAALVAVDAAAFAHVQRSHELLAATWGSGALQLRQGAIHLAAALAAGALLDRLRLRTTVVLAAAIFAFALPSLGDTSLRPWAGALYPAGISLYSAALVAAPALVGGFAAAPARAAWLYALAGWLGSGLGVGAAEDGALRGIAALGALLFALFALAELAGRRALRHALGPALAAGVGAGALLVGFASGTERGAEASDLLARGREVYVAEGCQHCHSQYVRPQRHDELWWGPRRPLDRTERPPTPGARRLGPDLANAGLRRSAWWHEAHLRDPRALSPGSRMPSYSFLFEDERGPALVAYLAGLGAGREAERAAAIALWRPPDRVGDAARGAPLFARLCAPCHGAAGRGDGAGARAIARPTLDLTKPRPFRAVPAPGEAPEVALARAIRFGLPPGSMPGHEWLSDAEVADLVAFVRALGAGGAEIASE
jgi:cytochrome c oxidase cbb3-type subunit 2